VTCVFQYSTRRAGGGKGRTGGEKTLVLFSRTSAEVKAGKPESKYAEGKGGKREIKPEERYVRGNEKDGRRKQILRGG